VKIAERIEAVPTVCHGKPHIAGTRIMVEQVLDLLASGVSVPEIISEDYFPHLSREDVLACVAFANEFLKGEEIHVYEPEAPSRAEVEGASLRFLSHRLVPPGDGGLAFGQLAHAAHKTNRDPLRAGRYGESGWSLWMTSV